MLRTLIAAVLAAFLTITALAQGELTRKYNRFENETLFRTDFVQLDNSINYTYAAYIIPGDRPPAPPAQFWLHFALSGPRHWRPRQGDEIIFLTPEGRLGLTIAATELLNVDCGSRYYGCSYKYLLSTQVSAEDYRQVFGGGDVEFGFGGQAYKLKAKQAAKMMAILQGEKPAQKLPD